MDNTSFGFDFDREFNESIDALSVLFKDDPKHLQLSMKLISIQAYVRSTWKMQIKTLAHLTGKTEEAIGKEQHEFFQREMIEDMKGLIGVTSHNIQESRKK